MLSDEENASLTPAERAELVRRFQARERPTLAELSGQRLRALFLSLVAVACVLLVPWIVLLAVTLPKSYVVHRWTAVWTGFDVALLAAIAGTAWAARRRRQLVIVFPVVGATLLTCDAWFDVMTASTWSDEWVSVASALLVELPLAAVLLIVARSLLRLTLHRMRDLTGTVGPLPPLYRIPLLGIDPTSRRRPLGRSARTRPRVLGADDISLLIGTQVRQGVRAEHRLPTLEAHRLVDLERQVVGAAAPFECQVSCSTGLVRTRPVVPARRPVSVAGHRTAGR